MLILVRFVTVNFPLLFAPVTGVRADFVLDYRQRACDCAGKFAPSARVLMRQRRVLQPRRQKRVVIESPSPGALRQSLREKSITVLRIVLCPLRLTRASGIAANVIARCLCTSQSGAAQSSRSRRSGQQFPIEKVLRERRTVLLRNILLLCVLCAMPAENFFTVDMEILLKKRDQRGEKEISVARRAE